MLTREQWENLARFAGITIEPDGVDVNGLPWYWSPQLDKHWNPEFDWRDFGPLWLLLEVWLGDGTSPDQPLHSATWDFECAKMEGDEKMLMQAGCLLGAAIGATMTTAPAADKETP